MASDDAPSEFNLGLSTIHRINYLLWNINESSLKNDVDSWFRYLKRVFVETDAFIKEDKIVKEHLEELEKIEKTYSEFLIYVENYNKCPNAYSKFLPPRKIFDSLFEWELKLRRQLDKAGLLMKKQEYGDLDDY